MKLRRPAKKYQLNGQKQMKDTMTSLAMRLAAVNFCYDYKKTVTHNAHISIEARRRLPVDRCFLATSPARYVRSPPIPADVALLRWSFFGSAFWALASAFSGKFNFRLKSRCAKPRKTDAFVQKTCGFRQKTRDFRACSSRVVEAAPLWEPGSPRFRLAGGDVLST
ncbi:hypothetical protein GJ654_02115 [Rhodoblastus acidophilus]|uniref:Uncharacterized protein n=1 Tax=Rhodoblastus acidophilus TaxID=1074 RepID=A0A6N8DJV2_RHOAC|nr:hypothetical protein [Rhodoblastus acidophilus]MCW2272878.1 hypothetical protein [Rhodoblastus acidophilus]MTV29785.1 hypothetical protein [Rhodoblastus acidophilus]